MIWPVYFSMRRFAAPSNTPKRPSKGVGIADFRPCAALVRGCPPRRLCYTGPMNFPPDLVIFDCDGVLVDSEPITNALIAEEVTARGLPMAAREAGERFVGGTILDVFRRIREAGIDLPDDWIDTTYSAIFDRLAQHTPIIEGIHGVLDALEAANIPFSVASNGPMRKMEITLGQNGLLDRLMPHIISPHDADIGMEKAKPNPGLFLEAAARRGVAPERAVVIEDSATGARAAKAAGIVCFGYAADTPEKNLTDHDARPFFSMTALPGLLGV